jgi:hypothetical protein
MLEHVDFVMKGGAVEMDGRSSSGAASRNEVTPT